MYVHVQSSEVNENENLSVTITTCIRDEGSCPSICGFFSLTGAQVVFFYVLLYSNLFVKSELFHVTLMYCGVLTSFKASGRDVDNCFHYQTSFVKPF